MKSIKLQDYTLPENPREGATANELEAHAAALEKALQDPLVRICNIYWIKNAEGQRVTFRPNWAQRCVLHELYIEGTQRLAIPKARQLGISTLAAIIALDTALFNEDTNCSIVDKTQPDAANKLKMVKYAYESLPEELRDGVKEDSQNALGWVTDSCIYAGKNARGATNQFLHISEFGIIAFMDPARAEEIETGAIPSASGATAIVIVESTHKGGKGGAWYNMVTKALETAPEDRTALDYLVMFFPWYLEPRYTLEGRVTQITPEINRYLDQKEKEIGRKFTPGQRLWYFKKRESLGRMIYSEFPTTIEECWMAPFPGAIYAPSMDKARADNRVNDHVLYYEQLPVYTTWDIGAPVNTKVWFWQAVGDSINYLECLTGGDDCLHAGEWVKRLKDKKYSYGGHFLPHDAAVDYQGQLQRAGLDSTVVLARSTNEWDNINQALSSFSRCSFNKTGCEKGIDALDAFRSKEETDGQTIRNIPVHDWASHASTAFGYSHQAIKDGLLVDRSAIPAKPRNGKKPQAVTGLRRGAGDRLRRRTPRVIKR